MNYFVTLYQNKQEFNDEVFCLALRADEKILSSIKKIAQANNLYMVIEIDFEQENKNG